MGMELERIEVQSRRSSVGMGMLRTSLSAGSGVGVGYGSGSGSGRTESDEIESMNSGLIPTLRVNTITGITTHTQKKMAVAQEQVRAWEDGAGED